MNAETAKALPDPGPKRWWRVSLNAKYKATPITVTLMESIGRGRALSSPLAFETCIADPGEVGKTAAIILARVGDYAKVVGEYGGE